ncbi:adenosine 3'-phospho 5'-phosphosulfate transporter 2 [Plodia interpunctella]|uniref:adenosine 3'-phospho 5'-phosphosulfate transporter 2 n=1 Tax=Plodia interpunctella TaxID=58824 RepID=UPI002367CE49|nr:adenosine 3'-phospho 5'-phosphosulfate transporter 2 [Plodia interpunctella]
MSSYKSQLMNSQKETQVDIGNEKFEAAVDSQMSKINILCLDLTPFSHLTQFLCCTVFVFICYLGYGYYVELIFSVPEIKPVSLYITLVQFIMTMLLSYAESLMRNPIQRKVPLGIYAVLAALTLGTMSLSNLALSYLNYPTQLIFKSCKLIPVMIGSIIILGKKYGFLDYVSAVIMCVGLTMFTLADAKVSSSFNFIGVVVISSALLCDAIIGNVQEKTMKQYQATNNEVVFYSYIIASGYLLVFTGTSGILVDGFKYCAEKPVMIYSNIFLLSLGGYMGLQAVLTLVRISGATVAVTVTTMRKALSIIISFLFFAKPFVFQYVWSGMLVALAIYLNHYSKKNPHYIPEPVLSFWLYFKSFHKGAKSKGKIYSDIV